MPEILNDATFGSAALELQLQINIDNSSTEKKEIKYFISIKLNNRSKLQVYTLFFINRITK